MSACFEVRQNLNSVRGELALVLGGEQCQPAADMVACAVRSASIRAILLSGFVSKPAMPADRQSDLEKQIIYQGSWEIILRFFVNVGCALALRAR